MEHRVSTGMTNVTRMENYFHIVFRPNDAGQIYMVETYEDGIIQVEGSYLRDPDYRIDFDCKVDPKSEKLLNENIPFNIEKHREVLAVIAKETGITFGYDIDVHILPDKYCVWKEITIIFPNDGGNFTMDVNSDPEYINVVAMSGGKPPKVKRYNRYKGETLTNNNSLEWLKRVKAIIKSTSGIDVYIPELDKEE